MKRIKRNLFQHSNGNYYLIYRKPNGKRVTRSLFTDELDVAQERCREWQKAGGRREKLPLHRKWLSLIKETFAPTKEVKAQFPFLVTDG